MKKIPELISITDNQTGKTKSQRHHVLEIEAHQLEKVKNSEPRTHLNKVSQKIFGLGDLICQPVVFLCFIFLTALFPRSVLHLENPGMISSLFVGPKFLAIPSRLLLGGFSLVGVLLLAVVLGLPGKILKFIANIFQPDISYLDIVENNNCTENFSNSSDNNNSEIRIKTYNLGLTPPLVSYIFNGLREPHIRVREFIYFLNKLPKEKTPHIICLQEIFTPDITYQLCQYLKSKYRIIYNIASSEGSALLEGSFLQKFFGTNSGLFFASQFPIYSVKFIQFSTGVYQSGVDGFGNKGVLLVVVKPNPNRFYLIVNTHLQSNDGEYYFNIRNQQLKLIHQAIQDYKKKLKIKYDISINDIIVLGDFNIPRVNEIKFGKTIGDRFSKINEFFFNEYLEDPKDRNIPNSTWTNHNPRYLNFKLNRGKSNNDDKKEKNNKEDEKEKFYERIKDVGVNYDFILLHRENRSLKYEKEFVLEFENNEKAISDHLPVMSVFSI